MLKLPHALLARHTEQDSRLAQLAFPLVVAKLTYPRLDEPR